MHIITENNLEIVVAYRLPPINKTLYPAHICMFLGSYLGGSVRYASVHCEKQATAKTNLKSVGSSKLVGWYLGRPKPISKLIKMFRRPALAAQTHITLLSFRTFHAR